MTYPFPIHLAAQQALGISDKDWPRFLKRFFGYIDIPDHDLDTRWPWTSTRQKRGGYAMVHWRANRWRAHRVSFVLANGVWPVPFGLHSCDTPWCVRPHHISAGTAADNTADAIRRRRLATKLEPDEAKTIKWAGTFDHPPSPRIIADLFGIDSRTVYGIWNNQSWCHVTAKPVGPVIGLLEAAL